MQGRWTKIVGGIVAIGVLAVGFVLAIPALFGGRIERAVRDYASEQLLADVEVGDVGLSLFAQFPLLQVDIDDVTVVGRDRYAGVQLLGFESLSLGVDLWSVLGSGPLEIRRVRWVEPAVDVRIEEDGTSNLDIFPPSDEPAAEEEAADDFAVELRSLVVEGLELSYADASLGLQTRIEGLTTSLTGRFDADVASIAAEIGADAWSLEEGGVTMLRDARLAADVDLDYALQTGAITLRDNEVRLNELAVAFAGTVTPSGDDTDLDLTFASEQTSFKALLSMVPSAYVEGYEDVKADGTFVLKGSAKGRMPAEGDDLPGFSMTVEVADGRVQYPDLPSSVGDIALAMAIDHPQGPADATVVDVRRFAFEIAGAPLAGSVRIRHPVSDPDVALKVKGTLDFAELGRAMPTEGMPPSGSVDLDLDIAGRASDFEAGNASAVDARGVIVARDTEIVDTGYPTPITVQRMRMAFTPSLVDLSELHATWLGSDLSATAQLANFVPYVLGTAPLVGTVDVRSKVLDLRPFQGETEETGDGTESDGVVVVVPEDLQLVLDGQFGEVITSEFRLADMKGRLSVAEQSMVIDQLTASMLGGRVSITGRYTAKTPEAADIDFRIETVSFDLPKTVAEFETLGRIAPLLRGVKGSFDSDFELSSRLGRDGTPDLAHLASRGALLAQGLTLTPVTLNAAAEKLKRPTLSSVEVAQKRLDFVIKEGQLQVQPFDAKLGGLAAKVSGGAGIVDQTLDLSIDLDVPTNLLQGSPLLKGLSGLGDVVDVRLAIGGTYDAPEVAVKLTDGKSLGQALIGAALDRAGVDREALIAEATRKGDQLVAEAEAQAAKIRAEGKAQADKLRREGKQQGDKLIRDAGSNPVKKAAATAAAETAKKSANRAADKVERESDAQANKIVADARDQRARLVREAGGG